MLQLMHVMKLLFSLCLSTFWVASKGISLSHIDIHDLQIDFKYPTLVSLVLASNYSLIHVLEPFLPFLFSVMFFKVLDLCYIEIIELSMSLGGLTLFELQKNLTMIFMTSHGSQMSNFGELGVGF